jgi:catechol 2,3-dioxygenase-like lactoylglutathione lyase family enzyme
MISAGDIHHIAIGVDHLDVMRAFYSRTLGFSRLIREFRDVSAPVMSEVARVNDLSFGGLILEHPQGGALLELIRRTKPAPRRMRARVVLGDIGLNALAVAANPATTRATGDRYVCDPEGNLLLIQPEDGAVGLRGLILGVGDISRAITFYGNILQANTGPVTERTVESPAEAGWPAAVRVRSVRMSFSKGGSWLELLQAMDMPGRSIPFGSNWGDFGYLQICFSCPDVGLMTSQLRQQGADVLCDPHPAGPGPVEEAGEFVYALDQDGTPIEFLHLPQ